MNDPVDNAPFREAWGRSALSLTEVARRANWMRPESRSGRPVGDGSRAARALGVRADPPSCKGAKGTPRRTMRRSTAETLCPVLGLDPVDVGI